MHFNGHTSVFIQTFLNRRQICPLKGAITVYVKENPCVVLWPVYSVCRADWNGLTRNHERIFCLFRLLGSVSTIRLNARLPSKMGTEIFLLYAVFFIGLVALSEGRHRGKGCPSGCDSCSVYNGCLTCKPRYYFLLHRSGMKQIGICSHACPIGFYPNSAGGYHRCSRCRIDNCETCYSRNFCSRCEPPYFGLYGKCVPECPETMYADERTGECEVKVDCEVSQWSPWSACMKMGQTCGYKWGLQSRLREIVTQPNPGGRSCPELSETNRCRVFPRYCPGRIPKRSRPKKKRKKDRETEVSEETGRRRTRNENKRDRTSVREKKNSGNSRTSTREKQKGKRRSEMQSITIPIEMERIS